MYVGASSAASSPVDVEVESEVEVFIFFATSEHGILMQGKDTVCMYVCMYVDISATIPLVYVYMYVFKNLKCICTYACMSTKCIYLYGSKYYVYCMYVCMYVCMYYVYIFNI